MPTTEKNNPQIQAFAKKLRELRRKSGLTQEEFAELTYCSSGHITKMERGLRLPSPHLLRGLIQVLAQNSIDSNSLHQLEELLFACKAENSEGADTDDTTNEVDTSEVALSEVELSPAFSSDNAAALLSDLEVNDPTLFRLEAAALNLNQQLSVIGLDDTKISEEIFGREETITRLVQTFQEAVSHDKSQVVVITGLGGIGKSTLALEVARRLAKAQVFESVLWESAKTQLLHNGKIETLETPSIWWNFSNSLTFEALLDSLVFHLNCADLLTEKNEVTAKLQAITAQFLNKPYLIVLDNLESTHNPKMVLTYLMRMLRQSRSSLLVTSREKPNFFEGYTVQLGALNERDAMALLKHEGRLRNIEAFFDEGEELDRALGEIIEVTGGHTLALKLAISELSLFSLPRVLERFRHGFDEGIFSNSQEYAGGFYNYVYRQAWQALSPISRQFLNCLKKSCKLTFSENELLALFIHFVESFEMTTTSFEMVLDELVRFSLIEVRGGLDKQYNISSLTRYYLNSDLTEKWLNAPEAKVVASR